MKLTLRYFASMKELMQCETETLELEQQLSDVAQLKSHLMVNNPKFADAVKEVGRLRVAVNLDMADDNTSLPENAEVAFFPPVTGG